MDPAPRGRRADPGFSDVRQRTPWRLVSDDIEEASVRSRTEYFQQSGVWHSRDASLIRIRGRRTGEFSEEQQKADSEPSSACTLPGDERRSYVVSRYSIDDSGSGRVI